MRVIKISRSFEFSTGERKGVVKHIAVADDSGVVQLSVFNEEISNWEKNFLVLLPTYRIYIITLMGISYYSVLVKRMHYHT